jgi:hypothetical protein
MLATKCHDNCLKIKKTRKKIHSTSVLPLSNQHDWLFFNLMNWLSKARISKMCSLSNQASTYTQYCPSTQRWYCCWCCALLIQMSPSGLPLRWQAKFRDTRVYATLLHPLLWRCFCLSGLTKAEGRDLKEKVNLQVKTNSKWVKSSEKTPIPKLLSPPLPIPHSPLFELKTSRLPGGSLPLEPCPQTFLLSLFFI